MFSSGLLDAAHNGDVKEVERMLQSGADINIRAKKLVVASGQGPNSSRIQEMLNRQINTHSHGQTALILAAEKGCLDVVRVLLEKGADLDAKDDDGLTALHHAVSQGHKDVAELLRNHGRGTS